MLADRQLLRRYAADGSEAAFGELVGRYVNLVYSAALRRTGGDPELAKDAAQLVFTDLARKARAFPPGVVLAGWLHRATRFAAGQLLRTERRRQAREQEAVAMNALEAEPAPDWDQIRPLLDAALDRLDRADRDALLLRFFEQRSLAEVGQALGANEDAVRKRVSRALERLRADLVRRGVTTTAAALSTAISVNAVQLAPVGLAATLTSASLAGAAAGTGTTLTLLKLMTMTKLQAGIISAIVVAGVATPLVVQHQAQVKLRLENDWLQQQMTQARGENERLSNSIAQAKGAQALSEDQFRELLRLRGEVGLLHRELAEATNTRAQAPTRTNLLAQSVDPLEQQRQVALARQQFIAKMGYAKNWVLALYLLAKDNQGQFPTSLDQAAARLPEQARDETLLATNQFDMVYQGSLTGLTNPGSTIVLRENQAQPGPNGGWNRIYGFADGHAEVHHSEDGNFQPWEAQHMITPSPGGP